MTLIGVTINMTALLGFIGGLIIGTIGMAVLYYFKGEAINKFIRTKILRKSE